MKNSKSLKDIVKTRIQNLFVSLVLFSLSKSQLSTTFAQGGAWSTEASMLTARYGPAADVISGKLYVASGAVVYNFPPFPRFTNLEVYDPVANIWATKAPIPIGIYAATAGAINGKLYVAGGEAAQNQGNNIATLQVYDPLSDAWANNAPMPAGSANACGGVIDGILYVAGGATPDNTGVVNNLLAYDPDADAWSYEAPMPTAFQGAGAGVVNGILYVVGGLDSSGNVLNTLQGYDPDTDTWTSKSPMPTARYFLAVGVVNGMLYAIGGINGNQVMNTVEAYNPAADTWTAMTPMPSARYAPAIGTINGVLYVVGGNSAPGSPASANLAVNEAFTPSPLTIPTITWNNPTSITYGSPLTPIQLNASANVSGNFAYNPPSGKVLDAGTNMLCVVFTPNDTDDYSSATNMVSLIVTPAPLTVSVANTNRPYGGTNPPFSGTIGVLVNGDDISLVYNCSATNNSPVGAYPIVPSLVDLDQRQTNYTVSTIYGSLEVTPVPLTVTAASASRPYGATNPVFTGTIVGLSNGDNITATYSTTATMSSPPGTYPIVPQLVDPDNLATNYNVSLVDGTLTVIGPVIQSAQQSDGSLTFSWSATTNQTYQIQSTASLAPANWTNSGGTITATNSTMTTSQAIGTNSQQFYRLVLLP